MDELKEKIARAIAAEDIPEMQWVELSHRPYLKLAQAALTAIEEAGYSISRLEARPADDSAEWTEIFPSQLQWCARYGHQVRAIAPYAALSDSATSFDPEKQFEKDGEEG